MRNLKKVLSLALALVMLLGMMVVGAGAATSFKDDSDIADSRKVAVAVANKIGVLQGVGDNTFNPDGTLTRAEAAVVLAKLDLGADAASALTATNAATFDDVGTGYGWAKAYIDYCAGNGYMVGVGGNNFAPGRTLTSVEFATMVCRVLGYKDENEYGKDGWTAVKAAALARKAGLGADVAIANADMSRADMAQMVLNALTAPMVEYTGLNGSIGDATFSSPATVRVHSGDQILKGDTTYTNTPATATTPIRLCEERFPDLKLNKTVDDETFGRTLSMWTWKRVEIAGTETAVEPDAVFTAETSASDVKKATNDAKANIYSSLYWNGQESSAPYNAEALAKLTANGRQVEVYLNETNKTLVDKVVVVDTALGEVTKVDSKNEKITIKLAGSDVVLGSPNLTTEVGYGDFEKGDMVVVTGYNKPDAADVKFFNDGKVQTTVDTVAEATVVTGLAKLKDNKNATITIDGTAYEMAVGLEGGQKESFTAFKLHKTKDSTLYLYELGGVEYVIKAVPGEDVKGPVDNLIAVASAYQSLVNGKIVNMVEGVLSNGQTVTWQTNVLVHPETDNSAMYRWADNDSDGIYTLTKVADQASVATTGNYLYYMAKTGAVGSAVAFSSTAIRPVSFTGMTNNYMYADDVKFIFVDADNAKGTADITVMNGQQSVDYTSSTNDTIAYAVRKAESGNYEITAVFMTNEPDVSDISDIIYVHKENPDNDQWVETTDGNKIYYGYVAYDANGELIEGFRGDKSSMANKFIQSKINEYEGYPMSKVNPKGTAIGKLTDANGLGGNAFVLSSNAPGTGYYTNTDTKVVDLTGKGLDSIREINKAFNNNTYRTIKVALIYTGKTDLVAKTVFVYEVDVKGSGNSGLNPADVNVQGSIADGFIVTANKALTNYEIAQVIEEYLDGTRGLDSVSVAADAGGNAAKRDATIKYVDGSTELVDVDVIFGEGKATGAAIMDKVQSAIESASDSADKPNSTLVDVTVEGNTLMVTSKAGKKGDYYSTSAGSPATHDLARFLGKLNDEGALVIKYDAGSTGTLVEYEWNTTQTVTGDSKSKWFKVGETTGPTNSLVGAIINDFKSSIAGWSDPTARKSFTIIVDGAEMNISFGYTS